MQVNIGIKSNQRWYQYHIKSKEQLLLKSLYNIKSSDPRPFPLYLPVISTGTYYFGFIIGRLLFKLTLFFLQVLPYRLQCTPSFFFFLIVITVNKIKFAIIIFLVIIYFLYKLLLIDLTYLFIMFIYIFHLERQNKIILFCCLFFEYLIYIR